MKHIKDYTTKELEDLIKIKARRIGMTYIYWDMLEELSKRYIFNNKIAISNVT